MAKESKLRMAPHLMEGVLSGEKEVTIRYGKREFEEEITIEGNPARVLETMQCKLIDTPLHVLDEDGFNTFREVIDGMKQFYPDITPESDVTIVKFILKVLE